MHHAVQLPLLVGLGFTFKAKFAEPFVGAYVGEEVFDGGHSVAVDNFVVVAVDAMFN